MDSLKVALRRPAFWLTGLIALGGQRVNAAAVDGSAISCGYGYKACPTNYDCVKASYQSTCKLKDYTPTPTHTSCTSSHKSQYPPGYTPPSYPPGYSPPSYPGYTPPSCPPGCSPLSYPPDYSPTTIPPGYSPTSYPPDYSPTTIPPGYSPTSYPPGYSPTSYPPGYSPTSYPPDYSPTSYPPGYSPTSYPPDYSPTSIPPGYQPSGYPSGYKQAGYPGYGSYDNGTYNSTDPTPPNSTFTPVIGVPEKIVERRPIGLLQTQYADVFNMLLLALESLQGRSESIDVSWYQISGIHGYPFIPWQYPSQPDDNTNLGYCTHHSSIFTSWHRPYLVLLEQLLHDEAVSIAKKFSGSDGQKYLAAADDVRLPYWDWASNDTQSHIPGVLAETSITVIKPASDGSANSVTIPNPLYDYRFANPQPPSSGLEATTVRAPNGDDILFATFSGRQKATLDLFSVGDYNGFSGDAESIHDAIHVNVGGDMALVPLAAFDPIFWLHHCQVDRIMAMYQATHPGVYLTPKPRSETFALHGPGPDDLSTPLYPFRHPNGQEWTSDEIKTAESIFTYGYAYPEVPEGKSGDDLRVFTTERVNQLYGPNTDSASFQGPESGAPQTPTARREWSANVMVDSEELAGSHRILLYIGPYDKSNPDGYQQNTDNLVGVAPIFTGLNPLPSPNRYLNITIPLTTGLIEKNITLRPEDVVPTLAQQFHWVVEKVGVTATPIPVTDLKSLQIAVTSTITEYPKDQTKLPIKYDPLTHYAPTVGKVGGIQPGEAAPVGAKAPPALDDHLSSGTNTTLPSTS